MSSRPSVSVIVPFVGPDAELGRLLDNLERVERGNDDELIVVDNRSATARKWWRARERRSDTVGARRDEPAPAPRRSVDLHRAAGLRSPGYARNCGAAHASGTWLLFVDADTRISPSLLHRYFAPLPRPSTAVLAGAIVDLPAGGSMAARHSAARSHLSQRVTLQRVGTPYAQTANCAVRRSAFDAVGGFSPEIRAGEDADLCFRLLRAGWQIESRPHAGVEHHPRPTIRALLGQLARHGSGAAWLNRRYPGEFPAPGALELARRCAHAARAVVSALAACELEPAGFALLDLLSSYAFDLGRLLPNQARVG